MIDTYAAHLKAKVRVLVECPNCGPFDMTAKREEVHHAILGISPGQCPTCDLKSFKLSWTECLA